MTSKPKNTGRNSAGRFTKGNKFGGKKAGSRHATTLAIEALMEGEHEALTRKAIELALSGDTVALKLCLDRLAPPRKETPVTFELPAIDSVGDTLEVSKQVLREVAQGKMAPYEAAKVLALLEAHVEIIEAFELEERLATVEKRVEQLQ